MFTFVLSYITVLNKMPVYIRANESIKVKFQNSIPYLLYSMTSLYRKNRMEIMTINILRVRLLFV